jgi:hypothetical protein
MTGRGQIAVLGRRKRRQLNHSISVQLVSLQKHLGKRTCAIKPQGFRDHGTHLMSQLKCLVGQGGAKHSEGKSLQSDRDGKVYKSSSGSPVSCALSQWGRFCYGMTLGCFQLLHFWIGPWTREFIWTKFSGALFEKQCRWSLVM